MAAKKKKRGVSLQKESDSLFDELLSLGRETLVNPETGKETQVMYDGDDLNIMSEIESLINDTSIVSRDLKIDDSSMPKASSYWHWITAPEFLGAHVEAYLEQALLGIKLFSEYCPKCSNTEWMKDENHVPQEGLDGIRENVVILENGVCPKCGLKRSHAMKNGDLNFYNELAVNAGQRSGKSIVVAMICTYITHRVLMMQKPTEIYNVGSNQVLIGTFVAITSGQAKDTLWTPYHNYILDSPWFQKYHALLDHYQNKYKQTLYKVMDSYVQYRHRNLFVTYAGPDLRALRGRTRIFGAIDEVGYFDNDKDSKKVKLSAQGVYEAITRSLLTCQAAEKRQLDLEYDEALSGYMLNVSSPTSVRDKICELVRLSEGSVKTLGLHKPTWEMNPNIPKDSEIIQEAYRRDPISAEKDYGANPPLSANPFISSRSLVWETCRSKGINLVKTTPMILRAKDGNKYRYAEIQKIKKTSKPSILAVDAGYTNNSFAITVGTIKDGIVNLDVLIEVMPLPGIPLSYSKIFTEIIVPVCEARNVRVVLADRWQSIKLLQDCEAIECVKVAKQYSVKYSDLWNIKNAIESQQITLPRPSKLKDINDVVEFNPEEYPRCFQGMETEHLLLQMLTVQDTGRGVEKGDNLTDDLWRAGTLCYYGLTNPDFEEFMVEDDGNKFRPAAIAKSRSLHSSAKAIANKTSHRGTKLIGSSVGRKS